MPELVEDPAFVEVALEACEVCVEDLLVATDEVALELAAVDEATLLEVTLLDFDAGVVLGVALEVAPLELLVLIPVLDTGEDVTDVLMLEDDPDVPAEEALELDDPA